MKQERPASPRSWKQASLLPKKGEQNVRITGFLLVFPVMGQHVSVLFTPEFHQQALGPRSWRAMRSPRMRPRNRRQLCRPRQL